MTIQESESCIGVQDAAKLMRENGFIIGDDFLMEGIRQGKFPFAFAIQGKTWRYWISIPKLNAWLKEWCGK